MRFPYALALGTVALGVAGFALSPDLSVTESLAGLMMLGFAGTGAVIARRDPRNAIGWLFLGVGAASALAVLAPGLADHGVARPGPPDLTTRVAAAYASASWVAMMLPGVTFLLLLFPDGHLLGPRWRWVARVVAAAIGVALVGTLCRSGPLEDYPAIRNPLGVEALRGLDDLGIMLLLVGLVACPVSVVQRYRRAGGIVREQIKWLAFAGAFAASVFLLIFPLSEVLPAAVIYGAAMASVLLLPVAAAVAILRHRLYDVDVVINRALVYAALTATLVGAYLVTVLLAQLVLPARSDLGVAVSTLAAAAVFAPARARIQALVDRRFFRRRYDAERTLTAFAARLRDEVDLAALSDDLRGVVGETVQPAHVSLWLR